MPKPHRQARSSGHATPRVVHLAPRLFGLNGGVVGGAERYVLELARHMADQTNTTLVTFGERSVEDLMGKLNVRVIGNPWYVRNQPSNPISARILKLLLSADVVHCHQQHIVASSLSAAICRLTRRRVFVSDLGGGGWDISAYVSTDRWYHGHLHISEYSRAVYGHQGRSWGHVISGGVDTKKFSPGPTASAKGPIVFVGRLLPHKGIDNLIDAANTDMQVEIIGQPYDRQYFDHLKNIAAGKQIRFRIDCGDQEMIEAYRHSLCVVLPSVYRTMYGVESKVPELLGQTLLEGMACGTAAVCTNVASMPEIVVDGTTGFVVAPNDPIALRDKLERLQRNPTEAREMGLAGRQRVLEHFTWPAVVDRCFRIYASRQ
jgi:glycosyltransferase involved in cell wall biosynthesis